ncbi:MAG: HDIG domain-containing protein, partial [Simkania negevensis]|nr:HDIG domain-containing protein [Simkania negevensis]
ATLILRQESVKDIGFIYQIKEEEVKQRRDEFEQLLIKDQTWRTFLPNSTFEDLSNEADRVADYLGKARFTDPRTYERLSTLQLLLPYIYLLSPSFQDEKGSFATSFWANLRMALSHHSRKREGELLYITEHFQGGTWGFSQDSSLQNELKQKVEKSVPMKCSTIQAGKRIVNQGEKITAKHVVMLKAMKKALTDHRRLWDPLPILSSLIFATIITLLGFFYLYVYQKKLLHSVSKLALYATIIVLTLILSKITEYFLLHSSVALLEAVRYPLYLPFAAILICVLLNAEIALFSVCFLTVILGFSLAVDPSRFITSNLLTGVLAILASRKVSKRKEVFTVCAKIWFASIPIFFVYNFIQNIFWNFTTLSDLTTSFSFLALTSILVVGLLPVFESLFHVMTDITLMEYMDPSNELLKRLAIEAPGTYHHSLIVGTIAEAAAKIIGANGLLCRVATLYHDVGKLFNPHYFTENQLGGFNIHQLLTPLESAQVIIAHVPEGEVLAKRFGLPQSFIDIIREHHGTTLVYYFYSKQVEQLGGDPDAVNEKEFRYGGPKPHSKESAIIMMADSAEAASRSLEDPNEESIAELVQRLLAEKLEDGQFDECQLTFEEFGKIKQSIIKSITFALHIRINYPVKKS